MSCACKPTICGFTQHFYNEIAWPTRRDRLRRLAECFDSDLAVVLRAGDEELSRFNMSEYQTQEYLIEVRSPVERKVAGVMPCRPHF
jgi:hypothetical protein